MRPALSFLCSTFVLVAASAQAGTSAIPYVLNARQSILEVGCQAPCACPVIDYSTKGTFVLVSRGFDGLYQNYDVTDVDWAVATPTEVRRFKGAGRYRVGGEVAVMQEMVLDLVSEAGAQHFSSGLVSGGGSFPKIDIDMAVHKFMCFDSVFSIVAAPASAGVGETQIVELRRVSPNPFVGGATVELVLGRASWVAVDLFDAGGRRVRSLLADRLEAGPHVVHWDGARVDGSQARPGIYRVRVSAGGRDVWRTAVKLD